MTDSLKEELKKRILKLPQLPGCYLYKNQKGEIIYVGKAKNLKKRVNSYFAKTIEDRKTQRLVNDIRDFDYIIVDDETESYMLEANLIKRYKPKYNIMLKDDKTYPFVKIDLREDYPKVIVTRKPAPDGSKYWGPFTNVKRLRDILEVLKKIFPYCDCSRDLSKEYARPCLQYQMKRCAAPCTRQISKEDYHTIIEGVIDVMNNNTERAINFLKEKMLYFAEIQEYENAAEMRDHILFLESLDYKHKVLDPTEANDKDFVGIYRDGKHFAVSVLQFRKGKVIGKIAYVMKNTDDEQDKEILKSFILQYYTNTSFYPDVVYVPLEFEGEELEDIEKFFKKVSDKSMKLHNPKRGKNFRLLGLSEKNAIAKLVDEKIKMQKYTERIKNSVIELQKKLNLPKVPYVIEGFDNSTLQGTETVASMVHFENGYPKKSQYRKFIIKSIDGQDDFRSMFEVITRRYKRLLEENQKFPDLILIDGGKGQLGAAVAALEGLGIEVPILGLAKRLEEIFLPGRSESIILPRTSPALKLLQSVRNEAHRFAITFHRKRRDKGTLKSELDTIEGIGSKRKVALLKHFGSMKKIKEASLKDLTESKILPQNVCENLYEAFHSDNEKD